jgi:signal transduction histidine kinase
MAGALCAEDQKATAKNLVKDAVACAKTNGLEKLLYEINNSKGRFHVQADGELYIFVYDDKGICRAQGVNSGAIVGVNRWGNKDPDGKFYIQELIKTGLAKGGGWMDYKYLNPKSGKVEPKTSYVEPTNGMIVGCGVYK